MAGAVVASSSTPGHTPGHTAYRLPRADTVVYIVVGCGDPSHSRRAGVEMKRQSPSECHKFRVDHTGNPDQLCAGGDVHGVDNRRAMRLAMDPHNQPQCKRQYCGGANRQMSMVCRVGIFVEIVLTAGPGCSRQLSVVLWSRQ
jgi:hypothetical protein